MNPEEALGGDELEGFVEWHDLPTERSGVASSLAAPPQHLNSVGLAGLAQPGNRPTDAQAVEGVALVRAHHLDAAAPRRPGVGFDASTHVIGAAGHRRANVGRNAAAAATCWRMHAAPTADIVGWNADMRPA